MSLRIRLIFIILIFLNSCGLKTSKKQDYNIAPYQENIKVETSKNIKEDTNNDSQVLDNSAIIPDKKEEAAKEEKVSIQRKTIINTKKEDINLKDENDKIINSSIIEEETENNFIDNQKPDNNRHDEEIRLIEETGIINISIIGLGDEIILSKTDLKFNDGQTAYDALKTIADKNGIKIKARGIGKYTYVEQIADLKEFMEGPLSGWLYTINGEQPSKGAGAYKLKENDTLIWKYSTDAS